MYTSLLKTMEFLDFIDNYWQFISTGIVIIITIVVSIVKRTKFNISLPANSYKQIIELIHSAEVTYGSGHGKEKLNFVVERFMAINDIKYFGNEVRFFVENLVEQILSTPEKKGAFDEKVK